MKNLIDNGVQYKPFNSNPKKEVNHPCNLLLIFSIRVSTNRSGWRQKVCSLSTEPEIFWYFNFKLTRGCTESNVLSRLQTCSNKIPENLCFTTYENVLDRNKAAFWKRTFARKAQVKRVPFFISALGFKFPVASALALLMDEAFASYDVRTVTAGILSELIVPGGKFIQYFTIRRAQENNPYVHSDVFYLMTVQGQPRL